MSILQHRVSKDDILITRFDLDQLAVDKIDLQKVSLASIVQEAEARGGRRGPLGGK